MKKLYLLLTSLFMSILVPGQTPQSFSYQAILRDGTGAVLVNTSAEVIVSILQGSVDGMEVFTETHNSTTNDFGLITLSIGDINQTEFTSINWSDGPYFLKISVNGSDLGTTQLLSVPYAMMANSAENFLEIDPEVGSNTENYLSRWNGEALIQSSVFDDGNIGIGTNQPSSLLDLQISDDFTGSGIAVNMPDYSHQSLSSKALSITSKWDSEGLNRAEIFSLVDEESSPIMTLKSLGYNYISEFGPGRLYMGGENGNNIRINWEEGFQYGTLASGYNLSMSSEFPLLYKTYSGSWRDVVRINKNGDAYFAGNLEVDGNISVDSIDVSRITGLLGQGFTLNFPDILNNSVDLEIEGINLQNKVVIINGPGVETERIIGYLDPLHHNDQPGLSMEYPLVFEATGTDTVLLKDWLFSYNSGDHTTRNGSIIIKNLAGAETNRCIYYDLVPKSSEQGVDGRLRFTMAHDNIADNVLGFFIDADFGTDYAINPDTDKWVEIEGISLGSWFFPAVEVDNENRIITLTMDYNEGGNLFDWVNATVQGLGTKRNISIIESNLQVPPTEISRMNYYYCFPVKYELISGFGLNTKLKARISISYDWREVAK